MTEAPADKQRLDALTALDNAKFSKSHVKAILVAGSGFFVDSYDNFVIGLMVPMIAYEYFDKSSLTSRADGWVKAASSYGNAVGQISFAILGDILGRKRIYGIELMVLIGGALLCAFASWPVNGDANNLLILLAIWRFVLGVGIGGDYPVLAVITSEFASAKRRGTMIATVFAMQGFGIIAGAVMAIIVLAAAKDSILENGASSLGYCWRTLAAFGAFPALAAVYWRLKIPETPRYAMDVLGDTEEGARAATQFLQADKITTDMYVKGDGKTGFFENFSYSFKTYFNKWANLKVLIGCAAAWFFLDIGYYGTSLNTSVVLEIIGYGSPSSTGNQKIYDDLWNRSVDTAIINLAGTVPGYWFTVYFVDNSTGHGISAASGKVGAIIAAQCFSVIAKGSFGFKGVLYIFAACCFFGLLFSFWVPETKNMTLEELSALDREGIPNGDDIDPSFKDIDQAYKAVQTPGASVQ
ncbi:inorganic phosphate transporter, putative [Phytophthora infestans T30-4]|uniref:Inorganic phosphate transporter, putative n=1 Tax=Phytophthora infestans (strain T30-4) TaxID=403677 RepID=D0MVQ9_PHYIT|nr:inorganic phosphate transporter, putative [Phytophthora infestans T30-4]EEY63722.1 inorganic phosphate transporter, putative [Phytophthora infestans T30-4]|eukprot:XP_002907158.1 inorganic phosphate transporter, putative [Phytophthora infestans T30-4]